MISTYALNITTVGSAGAATGSATTARPVNGRLIAVYVDYTSQPATTDITLSVTHKAIASSTLELSYAKTLLTLTNANTDGWFYPRQLLDDTAGADLTAIYDSLPVDGYLSVLVAQGDAITDGVKMLVVIEDKR